MQPNNVNWIQLLRRLEDNSQQLGELEREIAVGGISFSGFFVELLARGFTIPEAQELYTLLRA